MLSDQSKDAYNDIQYQGERVSLITFKEDPDNLSLRPDARISFFGSASQVCVSPMKFQLKKKSDCGIRFQIC